jgi:pimeloyl-ACP methyl ester carboxylesterase
MATDLSDSTKQWLTKGGFQYTYKAFWHRENAKPPTLILCGAFQNFQSWNSYVKVFLERGKSVILLALPGTGESEPVPPEYSIEFLADSIRQLLDHLGLGSVSIIAPSYSSPTAYSFVQSHPDRVKNLLLCGTMQKIPTPLIPYVARSIGTMDDGNMEQFANEVLGITGPRVGHGLLCADPGKPIARRKLALRILYSQLVNLSEEDKLRYKYNTYRLLQHRFFDLQHPPTVPVLVFTGEHDTFTKPHLCRGIAEKIPGAIFTTVLEADHMFHLEQFGVTSELFYRFPHGLPLDGLAGISTVENFVPVDDDPYTVL